MAEKKPLVNSSGVVSELSGSDTIPVANYPTMVGDSGAGGTKGAVPAPSAGDAAASKFLKADGTWATAGGGSSPLTTKGDIHTFSTVDARLAVGNNGIPLIADSLETTGLKYGCPNLIAYSIPMASKDGATIRVGSSGTVTMGSGGGAAIATTATGGSYAEMTHSNGCEFESDSVMPKSITLGVLAGMVVTGTDYAAFIGMARCTDTALVLSSGITFTLNQFGFKFTRASSGTRTLSATNGNGTTETATSFTDGSDYYYSSFMTAQKDSARIRFYAAGVLKATHTTNLPTLGGSDSNHMVRAGVTNKSTATASTLMVRLISILIDPLSI